MKKQNPNFRWLRVRICKWRRRAVEFRKFFIGWEYVELTLQSVDSRSSDRILDLWNPFIADTLLLWRCCIITAYSCKPHFPQRLTTCFEPGWTALYSVLNSLPYLVDEIWQTKRLILQSLWFLFVFTYSVSFHEWKRSNILRSHYLMFEDPFPYLCFMEDKSDAGSFFFFLIFQRLTYGSSISHKSQRTKHLGSECTKIMPQSKGMFYAADFASSLQPPKTREANYL